MRALALAFLLIFAAAAEAATSAEQELAERVFKATPATAGIWVLDGDAAAIRHVQSGLSCPAAYTKAGIGLWHLSNNPSPNGPGMDVGCDYGLLGQDGRVEIMLSVDIEKAGPGETLEAAFQHARADLMEYLGDARSKGAFRMPKEASNSVKERSELFEAVVNKIPTRASMTVSLVKGWILEVHATYRSDASRAAFKAAAAEAWRAAARSLDRPAP
jgi:hypothetical protein